MKNKDLKKKIEKMRLMIADDFGIGRSGFLIEPNVFTIMELCKKYALSVLPEEYKLSDLGSWRRGNMISTERAAKVYNQPIKEAKDKIDFKSDEGNGT